jgi:ribose transport system substrate-binding protein
MKRFTPPALALSALLLAGCSEPAEPEPAVALAWIAKECNSFFDTSRFGARLAAQDLTARGEATVSVELLEPDNCPGSTPAVLSTDECAAAQPQIASVEAAIAMQVDAIAISVSNPACVTPALDRAVDRGIKVLTFDSDAADSRRAVYYGMDNRAAGRLAARTLARFLGERGSVAIQTSMTKDAEGVVHRSTSTNFVERMAGIEEELANYPGIELVGTLPCIGNDPLEPACAGEIETLLDTVPELSGLLLSRGKVLREADLAEHAPAFTAGVESKRLRSVGFDAPDEALDNIRAGYAEVVIGQKTFGWGYDVLTLAYEMVLHGLEPASFYDSGWDVICPNNLEEYAAMSASHDFRAGLTACDAIE